MANPRARHRAERASRRRLIKHDKMRKRTPRRTTVVCPGCDEKFAILKGDKRKKITCPHCGNRTWWEPVS